MTDTKAYSTSQKSPNYACINSRRNPSSTYQHMFLEDFCHGFSFELKENTDARSFYDVTPEGATLKKLLTFQFSNNSYKKEKPFCHILTDPKRYDILNPSKAAIFATKRQCQNHQTKERKRKTAPAFIYLLPTLEARLPQLLCKSLPLLAILPRFVFT